MMPETSRLSTRHLSLPGLEGPGFRDLLWCRQRCSYASSKVLRVTLVV